MSNLRTRVIAELIARCVFVYLWEEVGGGMEACM